MKFILWFLGGIAVGMWFVIFLTDKTLISNVLSLQRRAIDKRSVTEILTQIPTPPADTGMISITPSPLPLPTATPTPKPVVSEPPRPTLTPTPIVPGFTSQEINGFIDRYSAQYGVDPNILRAIAICESGFDAAKISRNGKYWGLYQFSAAAWRSNRAVMGMSTDPVNRLNGEEAVRTAAYILSIGKGSIWPNCMP